MYNTFIKALIEDKNIIPTTVNQNLKNLMPLIKEVVIKFIRNRNFVVIRPYAFFS